VQVLRVFGHINGFGGGDEETSDFPFQPALCIFNETNLQRYDLVLDELSKAGLCATFGQSNVIRLQPAIL
jgi:hypothetical protein